jgi:hypothetical protein
MAPKTSRYPLGIYVFLGETEDALGRNVRRALEKRGAQVRALSNPFSHRFSWRLDSTHTSSTVMFEDGTCLADSDVLGVFLRRSKTPRTTGAGSEDRSYIQAEIEAAILGWIWSLPCPVINRLPAWLWYNPKPPIQFWNRLLQTSRLRGIDLDQPESEPGWLSGAGGEPSRIGDSSKGCTRACVVDQVVIWNDVRPEDLDRFETALIGFACRAGLSFVEFVIVKTSEGIRVQEVEPFPDLSRFCLASGRAITEALAKLFTDANQHLCRK